MGKRDCSRLTTQQKDKIFALYKKKLKTSEIMSIMGVSERKVVSCKPLSLKVRDSNQFKLSKS